MAVRKKVLGIRNSRRINETSIPHNEHDLRFEDIDDEDYAKCLNTTTAIHAFISDAQLYLIAEWNYEEYCKTLDSYKQLGSGQLQALLKTKVLILDINRVLLNLLASVRMYLDHTETSIKRRHSDASQNWTNFKQACTMLTISIFLIAFYINFETSHSIVVCQWATSLFLSESIPKNQESHITS